MIGEKEEGAAFPHAGHDHVSCVESALKKAYRICETRRIRMTPLRKRVLELVWSSHSPIGAYDILGVLHSERGGAAPPTVYRALDFLRDAGLIHRIESRNAFVGCAEPEHDHAGQFLICRTCGTVAEISDAGLDSAVSGVTSRAGFALERRTIELQGLCPDCLTC